MEGIANFCGLVKSGNLSLNQLRTGGLSRSNNSSVSRGFSKYSISGIFYSTSQYAGMEGEKVLYSSEDGLSKGHDHFLPFLPHLLTLVTSGRGSGASRGDDSEDGGKVTS